MTAFLDLLASPGPARPFGWLDALILLALLGTCIVIVVVDARARIIPNECNILVAVLGLAFASRSGTSAILASVLQGVASFLLFWSFRALYRVFRGRHGLGLGDVKFLGAAGIWIGLGALAPLVLVACFGALVFVGIERVRGRALTASSAIPFGPFLVLGYLVVLGVGLLAQL